MRGILLYFMMPSVGVLVGFVARRGEEWISAIQSDMNILFAIEKIRENSIIENSNCLSIKFIRMTQPEARTDDRK